MKYCIILDRLWCSTHGVYLLTFVAQKAFAFGSTSWTRIVINRPWSGLSTSTNSSVPWPHNLCNIVAAAYLYWLPAGVVRDLVLQRMENWYWGNNRLNWVEVLLVSWAVILQSCRNKIPGWYCLMLKLNTASELIRPTGPMFWLMTRIVSGSDGWIAAQAELPSGLVGHNMSAEIGMKLIVGFR
jgi:hypothetical protein